MAMERGGIKGCDLHSRLVWFCLASFLPHPAPHNGKNFLTPIPTPWGPCKTPPCSVKFYFVLICTTISTNLFNKTCIININIFEITTKSIPLNQTNF